MSKVKKVVSLAALCVKKPKTIVKGIKYLGSNGIDEFVSNMKQRANYEVLNISEQEGFSFSNGQYSGKITFSVLMPVYNVEPVWLERAIESVKRQTYINWELCIVDDCSTKKETIKYLKTIQDGRIKIYFSQQNKGISEATNKAAELSSGDYILLLDNDDVITEDALYEFSKNIMETDADILYSDHDIIDQNEVRQIPFFKPSWSPDLLLSQMYVGHLLGFKKEIFVKAGGFRTEYNGSQDYDLMLRMSELTDNIQHVEKVLYSWRSLPSSTAVNPESKPYAQTAGLNAIQNHLDRIYGEGKAFAKETENYYVYDVRYKLEKNVKVSIIIPTRDHIELLEKLIDSIYEKTEYKNYEIIILNNNSEEKETYAYFNEVKKAHSNIFIYDALFEFNWSKLNNFGISKANGDVFVFLNNDTEVITTDWLERLAENAMRKDIGVTGALLLYEDDTIQHAGVVLGMNGWADHVFKGMEPIHYGSPFVSPMVTRNVLACTGACMAVSKRTIEKIGKFNEEFIICGSDVELCLRAEKSGLKNLYIPYVKLYHYESKSRDSYIPPIDFELSEKHYAEFRGNDPYYNSQLDYMSCVPGALFEKNPIYGKKGIEESVSYEIPEIMPYTFREVNYPRRRINLLVPSINPEHVFGGISTALAFFEKLSSALGYDKRIILTDADPHKDMIKKYSKEYKYVECEDNSEARNQLVAYANRYERSIPVSKNDYFVFTAWWTQYCTNEVYHNLEKKHGLEPNKFIYFIQDYEPGFYPWSTRYLLAEASYKSNYPQIGVFNTGLLQQFMNQQGYRFYKSYRFEPTLNKSLKKYLEDRKGKTIKKKRQILLYGRPGTQRNAFELIVTALKKWIWMMPEPRLWKIISAGEEFQDVYLGNDCYIKSVGKLTIEEYAEMLEKSYAGISLMVSPHPSYPPLEMATFGIKVITNTYANKDLHDFSKNMISINGATPISVAEKLYEVCQDYQEDYTWNCFNTEYISDHNMFNFVDEIKKDLEL